MSTSSFPAEALPRSHSNEVCTVRRQRWPKGKDCGCVFHQPTGPRPWLGRSILPFFSWRAFFKLFFFFGSFTAASFYRLPSSSACFSGRSSAAAFLGGTANRKRTNGCLGRWLGLCFPANPSLYPFACIMDASLSSLLASSLLWNPAALNRDPRAGIHSVRLVRGFCLLVNRRLVAVFSLLLLSDLFSVGFPRNYKPRASTMPGSSLAILVCLPYQRKRRSIPATASSRSSRISPSNCGWEQSDLHSHSQANELASHATKRPAVFPVG